jgi:hypothetical protein
MRAGSLDRRLAVLEATQPKQDSPPWCNRERRVAHILSCANYREWTCPNLTPEKAAWRDAKLARYKAYFDSLGLKDEAYRKAHLLPGS